MTDIPNSEPIDLDDLVEVLKKFPEGITPAHKMINIRDLTRVLLSLAIELQNVRDNLETLSNHYWNYNP